MKGEQEFVKEIRRESNSGQRKEPGAEVHGHEERLVCRENCRNVFGGYNMRGNGRMAKGENKSSKTMGDLNDMDRKANM